MRILFVVPYVPSMTRNRSLGFIRALSALGHAVHVVALRPPEDRWAPVDDVEPHCARLEIFDLTRWQTLLNAARALPSRLPLQMAYGQHLAAQQRVRALASAGRFDVLHVEHLRGVLLATGVGGVPTLFDAVDSISLLFEQTACRAPHWRQRAMARFDLARTRRFEARAPFAFDRLVVTSERDREAFTSMAGPEAAPRMGVVSNGVALRRMDARTPDGAPMVLFTGKMSYHANAAAAHLLATDIMPRVWRSRPDSRLVIAGKDPSAALLALASDARIRVTGFISDLPALIQTATVAIAPLSYAVGVQNKVLEAMASGVAVVASQVAAAGIAATPGRDWLVSETSADLAADVARLLEDSALRERIGEAGRRFVEVNHRWDICAGRLVSEYDRARVTHQLASATTS